MEKLLINNNQEDLIELIKSVNEENKIYELKAINASAVLISQCPSNTRIFENIYR